MVESKERLKNYLNLSINSIFKILPLYEESNVGIETYIESLLFELYGLENAVNIMYNYEYISLLSTLESVKSEALKEDGQKSVIKREVFKCINIVKNMIEKLEEGA